jgi:hypothetical protein
MVGYVSHAGLFSRTAGDVPDGLFAATDSQEHRRYERRSKMPTFEFEELPGVDAEATSFEVRVVETGTGTIPYAEPQTVLHLGESWQIEAQWEMIGVGTPGVFGAGMGSWIISAYLESIGQAAAEHDLGSVRVAMAGLGLHTATLPILATTVVDPGPYKLVVTLTADNAPVVGPPGVPFATAGYMEGPILQFFKHM